MIEAKPTAILDTDVASYLLKGTSIGFEYFRLFLFLAGCPIIPFHEGMGRLYAQVMLDRERMGKRLEKADGWIATTAIYYGLPLVTHDRDFVGTRGLRLITASEEARAAQLRLPPAGGRPLNLDMRCQCRL
ncbi:MAG: PIN domain-containing protein [Gammaproteobacteria bacterium]